jgi:hypothetical protein
MVDVFLTKKQSHTVAFTVERRSKTSHPQTNTNGPIYRAGWADRSRACVRTHVMRSNAEVICGQTHVIRSIANNLQGRLGFACETRVDWACVRPLLLRATVSAFERTKCGRTHLQGSTSSLGFKSTFAPLVKI